MTKPTKEVAYDLMTDIMALNWAVVGKAEEAGLHRYLLPSAWFSIKIRDTRVINAADVTIGFQPNHGLDYRLSTMVTAPGHHQPIDTPEKRAEIASHFVAEMRLLVERAEPTARARAALACVTREVSEEAAREGISMELLRIEPVEVLVYGPPSQEPQRPFRQKFAVHVLIPHDDDGVLTEDRWTIDAVDAEEFGSYLRERTIPEARELIARLDPATSKSAA